MIESSFKTKELLVDVARKLFAEKGFYGTTMNDIALVSEKGRRTLYTYFRSKDEIYSAVIKSELKQLSGRLQMVIDKNIGPDDKLVEYINVRMDAIKEIVIRNGELKAEFFLDVRRVERVRRRLDFREKNILKNILKEGMDKGLFERRDPDFTALSLHYALKGFEFPYIRGEFDRITLRKRELIIDTLFNGLRIRRK